jgi:hypothetical protein
MVPRGTDVDLMKKWTEIPFSYFPIPQVPPMIKLKTQWAKNKVFKPQGTILYLTLIKITSYLERVIKVCRSQHFLNLLG